MRQTKIRNFLSPTDLSMLTQLIGITYTYSIITYLMIFLINFFWVKNYILFFQECIQFQNRWTIVYFSFNINWIQPLLLLLLLLLLRNYLGCCLRKDIHCTAINWYTVLLTQNISLYFNLTNTAILYWNGL